jgi:hypothetical protein
MVGGIIKKGADIIKKSKNIIKMTPEEIARRKKNLERLKWNKTLTKKQKSKMDKQDKLREKIDEMELDQDLKHHSDAEKHLRKQSIEDEGWDQLYSKGGSVRKQRRLAKRGWGVTKRK